MYYKKIELKARHYITSKNLSCPVDLNNIAKERNIIMVDRELQNGQAMYIPDPEQKIIIIDKQNQSPEQLRFNVAHELAHDILEHKKSILTNPSAKVPGDKSPQDRQADVFASELLIPTPVLKREFIKQKGNILKLASDFQVTIEAIKAKAKIKNLFDLIY